MIDPLAQTDGVIPPEPVANGDAGGWVPPALDEAFSVLAKCGLGPRQMREIEALWSTAIDELIAHVAANHPTDLAAVMRHLWHLRAEEPITPAQSILGQD